MPLDPPSSEAWPYPNNTSAIVRDRPTRLLLNIVPGAWREAVVGWLGERRPTASGSRFSLAGGLSGEKGPEGDPGCGFASEVLIDRAEAYLAWTDQPARLFGQSIERRPALEIQGTNIAPLLDLIRVVFEENAQRQPLRAADRGAIGIDSTSALGIEEGTGTAGMRLGVTQKLRVRPANSFRFDGHDRQVVQTTSGAAASTSQPLRMFGRQSIDLTIDLIIVGLESSERPLLPRSISFRRHPSP